MTPEQEQILSKYYAETGIPVDRLPYTDAFDTIHAQLIAKTGEAVTKQQVWTSLVHMRKSGRLPKIRKLSNVGVQRKRKQTQRTFDFDEGSK